MSTPKPFRIGAVVYPGFATLDLCGVYEPLSLLSIFVPMELFVIGPTLGSVKPTHSSVDTAIVKTASPGFGVGFAATHTYDNPPEDLDMVIVPGGMAMLDPPEKHKALFDFLKKVYPSLKYIFSICTGSPILADAGILDGKRATSNKASWAAIVERYPQVNWVPKARWTVDGKIWTTSGVTAGTDGILAWISQVHGEPFAEKITNIIETDRHTDPSWDPFADIWKVTDPDHGKSVQPTF